MPALDPDAIPKSDSSVTALVAQRGKRWVLDFFPNLRTAGIRWAEDDAGSMAASVAYYLSLSLFPMLLLLTSGIGLYLRFTHTGKNAEQQILSTVETYASEDVRIHIEQVLGHLRDHSLVSGPFGFVAAILAAIGVFAQIDRGFDRIFRIPAKKSSTFSGTVGRVLKHRFFAFIMLLSLGGMIVVLFTASMLIAQARSITGQTLPIMAHAFNWVELGFTILANALLFTLVYRVLPKRYVRWTDALRGGLLAAIIWELGRELLGVFFIGMRYTSAYGAIGSFIAILLWCYYAISILFFGAEYVQAIEVRRQDQLAPSSDPDATPPPFETENSAHLAKLKPRRTPADA
jgi:membrane protein